MEIPRPPSINNNFPIGIFDGASQEACLKCGARAVVKLSEVCPFKLINGCGSGTNTRGELLALWSLLHFSTSKPITTMHIYGDSKVIIDWVTS